MNKAKAKNKIIVTGGGTGGHLMPAMAICEAVLKDKLFPVLITDKRCEPYLPSKLSYEHHIVTLERYAGVKSTFKVLKSWLVTLYSMFCIILKEKPKLVIGCGGYSSAPLIIASILTGTKFVLHEQNAYVGRTNYFLSYIATKFFVSFVHTINMPIINSKKIVWTGIPTLDKHIIKKKQSSKNEITILITGGSQGAKIFDDISFDTIKLLTKKLPDVQINVIQQVREQNCAKLIKAYSKIGVLAEVANFYHNIEEKYATADIFIGRAGAATVNEIIQYEIPSVLIPYPYAKNNHQYYNALNLREFEAAWLVNQSEVTPEKLSNIVFEIIKKNKDLKHTKIQLKKMQIESKKIILQEIHKIIDKPS